MAGSLRILVLVRSAMALNHKKTLRIFAGTPGILLRAKHGLQLFQKACSFESWRRRLLNRAQRLSVPFPTGEVFGRDARPFARSQPAITGEL